MSHGNLDSTVADLRKELEEARTELTESERRNKALAGAQADAIVHSAETIDELEQTKRRLQEACQREEKARRAAERLTSIGNILDSSDNEIYIFDACSLRFVHVNHGARANLGYSLDELRGMTPLDLKPEFSAELFETLIAPLRDGTSNAIRFATNHLRKDGSLYPVEVNLQSSTLEQRAVFVAIILDVTERKQAEDALQARNEELACERANLQTIFDAAQVGMFLLDADTRVTRVNDVATHLVGREASDLLSHQPGDGFCCIHAGETPKGCGHATACPDCRVRNTIERALKKGERVRNVEATIRVMIKGEETQLSFAVNATPLTLGGEKHALLTLADITARKQTEAELGRSETKFRTLYDSTSDAVMLLDEKGFFDCNDATVQIFGCRDKAEFCTKHPADLSPAFQPCGTDSMTLANRRIATAMEKGTHRFEWMHKRLDTDEDFAAEVLLNALQLDGRPVLQAVVRDIAARKQAEDDLRENKDRFERVAMSVSDLIYEWDVTTDQLEWMGDIDAALGYPQGTIPPTIEGWLALIHPEDHEKIGDAVEHHRQSAEPINVTYRIRHKDGDWRHWEDRGSAILDDTGSPIRVIGACSDATERMRAAEALRESDQRFLSVLHAADDAILLIDAETFVDCNDATARMLGYPSRDGFLMTHPSELSPPVQPDGRSSFEKAGEMMRTAFDKGFHRFEWMHRKANGEDFPVEVSLTPITYQGKTILHCLWRDLTERKQAEAERNRLNQELIETSRLAGMADVATGVLHNVGNVLNSVNVSGQLVAERVKTSRISGLSKAVALIEQHADDLATFITADERGKLLPEFLRALSEQLDSERGFVMEELDTLMKNVEHIKEIVNMQQSFATTSGVTIPVSLTDLAEDGLKTNDASFLRHNVTVLREYEELPQVTTDRHKVLQILVNLIGNAKQALAAADADEKRLTLRVVRSHKNRVAVEVEDNGVGISTDNLSRIFQHGFTTKKKGHGFGLHSSALAAKELGGALTAHSDGHGQGATFTLELPFTHAEDKTPAPTEQTIIPAAQLVC